MSGLDMHRTICREEEEGRSTPVGDTSAAGRTGLVLCQHHYQLSFVCTVATVAELKIESEAKVNADTNGWDLGGRERGGRDHGMCRHKL